MKNNGIHTYKIRAVWIRILLVCFFIIANVFILATELQPAKASKIAILKSEWCNINSTPAKNDYRISYYYAYNDFYNILSSIGKVNIIENKDITSNNLNYDVVILITPTASIDYIQSKNLKTFVDNGGRLVIIADHTNLYGHVDSMKELLAKFNTKINDDALYHQADHYKDFTLNIPFSSFNKITPKTASSIIPSSNAKIWAFANSFISEKADYTNVNFFGNLRYTPDDTRGSFPTGITIKSKKGYLVVWTDSTLFSNFAICQPNNIRLLNYIVTNNPSTLKDKTIYKYKQINIFSMPRLFLESMPKDTPLNNHYSTLLANFTKFKFLPNYETDFAKINSNTLLFINYKFFINNLNFINSKKAKVAIIDDLPSDNILGFKKYSFLSYKMLNNNECDEFYYSKNGKDISTKYKDINVIVLKGVISDNELGKWWNVTPISPYKISVIDSFFNWLKGNTFTIYKYPCTNCFQKGVLINFETGEKESKQNICYSKPIAIDNNQIIYMGNRKWAFLIPHSEYFLLGGPEVSDSYIENGAYKWTLKYSNSNYKKPPQRHSGCPLSRLNKNILNPDP